MNETHTLLWGSDSKSSSFPESELADGILNKLVLGLSKKNVDQILIKHVRSYDGNTERWSALKIKNGHKLVSNEIQIEV